MSFEDVLDELSLAGGVSLAVVGVIVGESNLELGVGVNQGGVSAEHVPEGQLLETAAAAGRHQVQVRDAAVVEDLDEEPTVGALIEFGRHVVPVVRGKDVGDRVGGAEVVNRGL